MSDTLFFCLLQVIVPARSAMRVSKHSDTLFCLLRVMVPARSAMRISKHIRCQTLQHTLLGLIRRRKCILPALDNNNNFINNNKLERYYLPIGFTIYVLHPVG